MAEKIRDRISKVLNGELHIDWLNKAERSFISKYIYLGAVKVLNAKEKNKHIDVFNQVPALLKPVIKAEVDRLIILRN